MFKKLVLIFALIWCFMLPSFTYAQIVDEVNFGANQPAGVKYAEPTNTPGNIISRAVVILMVVGTIGVLAMMLWGATEWIFSGGDKEKVSAAQKKITAAIVGLILVALTFIILNFIGKIVVLNPLQNFKVPGLGTDEDVSGGASGNTQGPGFTTGNTNAKDQPDPKLFKDGKVQDVENKPFFFF